MEVLNITEEKKGLKTIEEHVELVKNAIEFLKGCSDFKTEECNKYLAAIREASNPENVDLGTDGQDAIEKLVTELEYAKLFPSMWKDFHSCDMFADSTISQQAKSNFVAFKGGWWNFTDWSVHLVHQLAKADALKLYASDLKNPDLTVDKIPDDEDRKQLIKGTLSTICNMVRHCKKLRKEIRHVENIVGLLQTYSSCEITHIQANCALILAYILHENEENIFEATDNTLSFLVDRLRESANQENHRGIKYRLSSAEVMKGLNHIAINDNNKIKILDKGAIPSMVKMLGETFSIEEHTLAAEGFWRLAFDSGNKRKMKENEAILSGLLKHKDSEDDELKSQCRGALWEILDGEINLDTVTSLDDLKKPEHKRQQAPVQQSHVMISYQWNVQPRMLKLRDWLQAEGYNVWIDKDRMGDNLLDGMAEAVENAAVVLVCFSEKYKESQNCRSEAEYAWKLKKRIIPLKVDKDYEPDGWLGLILGAAVYYKFCSDDKHDCDFKDLIRQLGQQEN